MESKGTLYLIPTTMGAHNAESVIPAEVLSISRKLKHFIAENDRTARRYLKSIDTRHPLDDLQFYILNKRTAATEVAQLIAPLLNGIDMGLISEAGLPAIADPGAAAVAACHRNKIKVVPCVGPTSIVLALIASGFNGQAFTFHGYLPKTRKDLIHKFRSMENEVRKNRTTQIFMETPFRNEKLFEDLMNACSPGTEICVATDITLESEVITTRTVDAWWKHPPRINKRPCMFLMGTSM